MSLAVSMPVIHHDMSGSKRRNDFGYNNVIESRGSYDDFSLSITGTIEFQNSKKSKFATDGFSALGAVIHEEVPKTNVMNVNSLLSSSDADYEHPFFQYIQPTSIVATKKKTQEVEEGERPFFKFDKSNPKHVEIENLNTMNSSVSNDEYEGLKIQEISQSPLGGPRLSKVQQLSLVCENLQFLELFSLKQLTHFTEGQVHLPQLRSLRLLMLNRLTNQGLNQLLTCSDNLEQVFLMDLQTVTTVTLPAACQNLRALDLYECKAVETLQILTPCLRELTLSDGRNISTFQLSNPISGLKDLREMKISGCPKLPMSFLYSIQISNLKKLELVSNAPSAKAYMKVDETGFDGFVKANCNSLHELSLDKVHNISLNTVLAVIDQCRSSLVNVTLDLTSVEKPKVREALRHCDNLKDWKVEKWYIKKKWTEW